MTIELESGTSKKVESNETNQAGTGEIARQHHATN